MRLQSNIKNVENHIVRHPALNPAAGHRVHMCMKDMLWCFPPFLLSCGTKQSGYIEAEAAARGAYT